MASQRSVDPAAVVLLLGNFAAPNPVLELSENSRFAFAIPNNEAAKWCSGHSEGPPEPVAVLEFGENLYSPTGWVLGSSNSDNCDFQLAIDNRTGISRRHAQIDVRPGTCDPRLKNIANNPIRIWKDVSDPKHLNPDGVFVDLEKGDHIDILSTVVVDFGEVAFGAWRPALTDSEKRQYHIKAEKFSQEFLAALPSRRGSIPESVHPSGTSTLALRFGSKNTVYKRDEIVGTASGSFGFVMRVHELTSGKVFAAKVPHFKRSDSADRDRQRYELLTAEYQKLVALKHPNVVEAIEVLTEAQRREPPWLIMEWIPDSLDVVSIDEDDAPVLLAQISDGLAFMHDKGYAHRDLKPENILVQMDGNNKPTTAKIADFGATKLDPSGQMTTYVGTTLYMAPEISGSESAYTNAVDIWSLGVMSLELLTNWKPSSDVPVSQLPSPQAHKDWIRDKLRPRLATAPERYKPLLLGQLCDNPQQRWTANACSQWLADSLQSVSSGVGRTSKKRPASLTQHPDLVRYRRSAHPTLSPTRAVGIGQPSQEPGCTTMPDQEETESTSSLTAESLPDTAPWGSSSPRDPPDTASLQEHIA